MPARDGYELYTSGPGELGGALGKRGEMAGTAVRSFIVVDSIDEAVGKVEALGGSITEPDHPRPGLVRDRHRQRGQPDRALRDVAPVGRLDSTRRGAGLPRAFPSPASARDLRPAVHSQRVADLPATLSIPGDHVDVRGQSVHECAGAAHQFEVPSHLRWPLVLIGAVRVH